MLNAKKALAKLMNKPIVLIEGSYGNWYYRKWSDHKVELWGRFTQTVSAYAANSWVVGASSVTGYPFAISNPISQATCEKIGTSGGVMTYDYRRTDYWSGIANAFMGTIPQGSSRDIIWTVYTIGTWS